MCCIVPLIVECLAPAGSAASPGPIGGARQVRLESSCRLAGALQKTLPMTTADEIFDLVACDKDAPADARWTQVAPLDQAVDCSIANSEDLRYLSQGE
jgi:hypothetical protein